jgi:hypothetical protein
MKKMGVGGLVGRVSGDALRIIDKIWGGGGFFLLFLLYFTKKYPLDLKCFLWFESPYSK